MSRQIRLVAVIAIAAVLACRRNGAATTDAGSAAPTGLRIDRSCQRDLDCYSTCRVGPVNKAWWHTALLRDCKDGCDSRVSCVQNKCVPTSAIADGVVDWKHHCLERTHLEPDEISSVGDADPTQPRRAISAIVLPTSLLAARGVTPTAVREAVEATGVKLKHAGFMEQGNTYLLLLSTADITDALRALPIAAGESAVVPLKEIATIPASD